MDAKHILPGKASSQPALSYDYISVQIFDDEFTYTLCFDDGTEQPFRLYFAFTVDEIENEYCALVSEDESQVLLYYLDFDKLGEPDPKPIDDDADYQEAEYLFDKIMEDLERESDD